MLAGAEPTWIFHMAAPVILPRDAKIKIARLSPRKAKPVKVTLETFGRPFLFLDHRLFRLVEFLLFRALTFFFVIGPLA